MAHIKPCRRNCRRLDLLTGQEKHPYSNIISTQDSEEALADLIATDNWILKASMLHKHLPRLDDSYMYMYRKSAAHPAVLHTCNALSLD